MAPGWFGPPNAHTMRQQQAAPQGGGGGGGHYHPQAAGGQRKPPQAGSMDSAVGVQVPSPHQNYHQRGSPPMRGAYHPGAAMGQHLHPHAPPPPHGPVGHPHGPRMAQGGGRFPVQHPSQAMVVGGVGPRQMPPNAPHGGPHSARHHAPSPGMPRRMQMPPNAMRPIPHSQQTPRSAFDQQQRAAMQQQHGAQHSHHMMRLQQEHQQQQMQQRHLQSNSSGEAENKMHQNGNGHFQPPPQTPEQRAAYHSRESPSPPPVPPPHAHQQQQSDPGAPRPSPASIADSEGGNYEHTPQAQTPSSAWSAGPGMGPLRESRLQNMPQKHLYNMQQQQQHAQPQRPHPHHHHPGAAPMNMNHRAAFMNENMQRFQAMQQHQQTKPMGPNAAKLAHQHQMARANAMLSPAQQQQQQLAQARALKEQQQKQQQTGKKPGPDVTMDAASMLLALRTSASPATVSQATLEEQQSKDQADDSSKTVPMTVSESQDKDDHDDEVPELQSSSSSMSIPKSCNAAQDEEEQYHVVPKNFPTRLALPNDEAKLNSLHCFLRSELLEIFVVERSQNKSPTHSPGSSVGRVGLRCVFCAMQRKRNQVSTTDDSVSTPQQNRCDEAPMAVFYPKSIAEIYRLVTSWQRCHLRKCRNLPPDVRSKWQLLRENDKSRGKTHYWITSAKEIGLMDCQSRAGGIRFASPCKSSGSAAAEHDDSADEKVQESGEEGAKSSAYQPYNIPNFKEGPSQKQREASSMAVNATPASSSVESPLKENATALKTPTSVSSSEAPSASGVNSSQKVAMVGV